jgi:hypothetical protein
MRERDEMTNDRLTKRDVALGGKIRCEGCGAEWWVSSAQAKEMLENGWPTICGNNKAIDVPNTRTDCEDETEMTFLPYDVEENMALLHAAGQHEAADAMPAQAAKILEEVED